MHVILLILLLNLGFSENAKEPVPVIPLKEGITTFQVEDPSIYAKTKIIKLKKLKASEIEEFIKTRLSKFGKIQVNDEFNLIILTEREPKLSDLCKLIQELDKMGKIDFVRLSTEILQVKHLKASDILGILEKELSQEGKISANDELNVLVVRDVTSRILRIKKILDEIDQPIKLITEKIKLKYAKASEILRIIQKELSAHGKIEALDEINSLVVRDLEKRIQRIKEIITLIDIPPKQLSIEVKIIKIDKLKLKDIGIDLTVLLERFYLSYRKWKDKKEGEYQEQRKIIPPEGGTKEEYYQRDWREGWKNQSTYFYTYVDLERLINFLEHKGLGEVVATTKLVALNDSWGEAKVEVGWQTHIYLRVRPLIGESDLIKLDVEAALEGQSVKSTVSLYQGHIFNLCGLTKTTNQTITRRLPILGHIFPWFFSKKYILTRKEEFLVCLIPSIISTAKDISL